MDNTEVPSNKPGKLDERKMSELADLLKMVIPGCGFALVTFEIENGSSHGNYISNVNNDYMIKVLEHQLNALKSNKVTSKPIVTNSTD